ncbi:MAG: hypothetical protein ABJJ25_14005 [Eudoraea sp.]|uniref:hypothetical protein n=1 Tax=Eudoraea sp. TaxID=1979955 RepID=UPI003263BD27
MGYFHNVLVSVDQLGNAICGGNPDNTISARVGYFSQVNRSFTKWFWKTLEQVINFTFWPIDGPNHCQLAFEADPEEIFFDKHGDLFRALLSIIIVISCIPISIILYVVWLIKYLLGIKS